VKAVIFKIGSLMVTTFVLVEGSEGKAEGAPAEAPADDVFAPQAAPIVAMAVTPATKPVTNLLFIVMSSFLMLTACLGNCRESLYPEFSF
jgi:hypothetical protein